jgi:hypothetical protein
MLIRHVVLDLTNDIAQLLLEAKEQYPDKTITADVEMKGDALTVDVKISYNDEP